MHVIRVRNDTITYHHVINSKTHFWPLFFFRSRTISKFLVNARQPFHVQAFDTFVSLTYYGSSLQGLGLCSSVVYDNECFEGIGGRYRGHLTIQSSAGFIINRFLRQRRPVSGIQQYSHCMSANIRGKPQTSLREKRSNYWSFNSCMCVISTINGEWSRNDNSTRSLVAIRRRRTLFYLP